jgi:hypothetical protein
MTLRIDAGDKLRPDSFEIVRDPTGAPESRYCSTTTRNTSRARVVSS